MNTNDESHAELNTREAEERFAEVRERARQLIETGVPSGMDPDLVKRIAEANLSDWKWTAGSVRLSPDFDRSVIEANTTLPDGTTLGCQGTGGTLRSIGGDYGGVFSFSGPPERLIGRMCTWSAFRQGMMPEVIFWQPDIQLTCVFLGTDGSQFAEQVSGSAEWKIAG
jgi:hypothetical protein